MRKPAKRLNKLPRLPLAALAILTALASVPITQGAETDPSFTNPANLGPAVNSSANDYDPNISADELELYFNSYRAGGLGQADLWVTTRKTKADPWGRAVNLGAPVNSPAGDKGPCITADGLSLYFSSDRPGGHGGLDLWVTTRKTKGAPWGEPVNLGPTINSAAGEHAPSISTDELELYFTDYPMGGLTRPGGLGRADLWVTTRKTKGDPWGTPVNLGPTVNSSAWDQSPSISGDGLSLYLDDDSSLRMTTRKSTSDPWGTPVKLGPAINRGWTVNADISRDGSTLTFASTRRGGVGASDIWQATLGNGSASTPESKAESKQPRFAARTFNSSLPFYVYVQETAESSRRFVGRTPSATPLQIPGCRMWDVAAVPPVKDWDLLVREITQNEIPGLGLAEAKDADLEHLKKLPGLQELRLDRTATTDAGLRQLKGLTKLQVLSVNGPQVTNAGLEYLKALTELQSLELQDTQITDAGFEELKGLAKLQSLNLRGTWITDAGLERLKVLAELQSLDAGNTRITDAGLQHLKDLTKLQALHLQLTRITDAGLKHLSGLKGLRQLGLEKTAITDAGLTQLKDLIELRQLKLLNTQVTDAGVARLKGLTNLESLDLSGTRITDAGLAHFKGLPKLQLTLSGTSATEPAQTLHQAAAAGDLARVQSLLDQGADVSQKDNRGWTPLHHAVRSGRKEVVQGLLGKGASAEAADFYGRNPLHLASGSGKETIATLLLAKGANISVKDNSGSTALHAAAGSDNVGRDFLEFLLAKGADVKATNMAGQTPLHRLAWRGKPKQDHKPAAAALLAHGAEVNAMDKWGFTPLHITAENGQLKIVEFLLAKGAVVDKQFNDGLPPQSGTSSPDAFGTPLHAAAKAGHNEIVELLIAKGANVNAKDTRCETPAQVALAQNRAGTARLLLAKGGEVCTMQLAAYTGDLAKVKDY